MSLFVSIANQLSAGVKQEFLSPGKVRLVLSGGFPYEAFGGNGVIRPWHILNMVEFGRALAFHRTSNSRAEPFLRIQDLYADSGIFTGSARLNIAKEMYDVSVPKTPLTLEKELVYAGKSSFNVHTDVFLPSRGLTLATCEVQSVVVDRQTRRPSFFPDWWKEKFGGFTSPGRQLKVEVQKVPTMESPESKNGSPPISTYSASLGSEDDAKHERDLPIMDTVMSLNLTVNSSDSDSYGHANWAVSLKYCMDALMMGTGTQASSHLETRGLKSADIAFISEGLVGHRINVKFWKDGTHPGAVHFNMWDTDSHQLMSYAFLQFYSLHEVQLPTAKL